MSRIIVMTNLTLDGVMQAPGSPDEDPRDGFEHGGWASPYGAMSEAGEAMARVGAVLFGRWTYESFYSFWPNQPDSPFSTFFNETPKYVASTTLTEPLPWQHSILLDGELSDAVRRIKDELEADIVVFGSGVLAQSLLRHGLVDEFVLLIHPLVLGSGRRLFPEGGGASASLQLRSSKTTDKGVMIGFYEPVQA
jgi:dihydrofolate reductase